MQLGGAVSFCDTFDTKNPGIPSRTGDLDPNVWGVSRAIGETIFRSGYVQRLGGDDTAADLQWNENCFTAQRYHDLQWPASASQQ